MKLLKTTIVDYQRQWDPLIAKALAQGKVLQGCPPKKISSGWQGIVVIKYRNQIIILWDLLPSPNKDLVCGLAIPQKEISKW